MEKESPKRMKSNLCIPRLKGITNCAIKSNRLSPMTLFDRFREAMFRLMMLSALSKATSNGGSPDVTRSYYQADAHHSEAVADCIEFIKKTTLSEQNSDSTASNSIDASRPSNDMSMPVPVM